MMAFCLLHVSVIWYYIVRKKSKNYLLHWSCRRWARTGRRG